ncbi:hypothetical protein L596_016671 [Steinernema carpocapsae]|uniref:Uncharacterized protein n=1 Tax=Steinernema carpocapsae TaxID=34508 RepID=A0A4U5NJH0_STECR|nr:hypothetical protein L596_016671 [Steinernema carpocapsae]
MDTVPVLFRQSVAACLTEPDDDAKINSYVFSDPLWTQAIQTEWRNRHNLWVFLCEKDDSSWEYTLIKIRGDKQPVDVGSVESVFKESDVKFGRIRSILIKGKKYEMRLQKVLEDGSVLSTVSFEAFMKMASSMLPAPGRNFPNLNIYGHLDEATQRTIVKYVAHIDFVGLRFDNYTPTYDPILEKHLKSEKMRNNCNLTGSIFASSTLALIRSHFQRVSVLGQLEIHNPTNPFSFADFETMFDALLKMPVTNEQVGNRSIFVKANFETNAIEQLRNFRRDLACSATECFHWLKSIENKIFIEVVVSQNHHWEIRLV